MPVVTLYKHRLETMLNTKIDKILELLPYITLDIEEVGDEYIKVEYNPNRPDLSTDYGIVRALKGLMGIEEGIVEYKQYDSDLKIVVDDVTVRPYLVALLATNGELNEYDIKQLISMQEDLNEGIGRKRRKIAIGIHDYDKVNGPLVYTLATADTKFIPLNEDKEYTLKEILNKHELGVKYGKLIGDQYPIIKDSNNKIISFPPIINSDLTKINEHTKDLLVEITSTDLKTAEDALSILAITLFDMGFNIKSVKIEYNKNSLVTPRMHTKTISVSSDYINRLLGLRLDKSEIIKCLRKSRLDGKVYDEDIVCIIPRYRFDILNEIDIVEEVLVGYGVYNLEPSHPTYKAHGVKDSMLKFIDKVRLVMVGLQAIEVINFTLVSKDILKRTGLSYTYEVEHSKSKEHEVLRPSLVPSILQTLASNIHQPYPQRLFEIGKVFEKDEEYRLVFVIASKEADYTQVKSHLQTFIKTLIGKDIKNINKQNPLLKEDISANIMIDDEEIGIIGEVKDEIREAFKIRVRVALFEVSIDKLYQLSTTRY